MKMTCADECRCRKWRRSPFYPGGVHLLSVRYDGIKLVNLGHIRQGRTFEDTC